MQIKIGVTRVKKLITPVVDTSISLDSNTPVSIPDGFHGISTQEVWKRGSNPSNYSWFDDLFSTDFVNLIKELNPSALQHPGLANSDLEIVDIGNESLDTITGDGGFECRATSGCVTQGGLCCPNTPFGHPAFANLLELSTLVSTPTRPVYVSHVMNPQVDAMSNLQTWIDQAEWKLQFCTNRNIDVKNIQLGIEQNTGGNDIWWNAVGQTLNPPLPAIQTNVANYITKIDPGVQDLRALFPNAKIFFDTSPIAETTNRDLGWKKGLVNSGVLDYDGVREYMMHHNFPSVLNLSDVLNIKDVIIPQRLTDIDTYYSGKLVHVIYGLPDQDSTPIHETILGLMFIFWTLQSCLDWNYTNNQKVFGMNYQSLTGLIKQSNITRKPHFYAIKVVGNFLDTDSMEYIPVTLTGSHVGSLTGICSKNSLGQYRLVLVNYSGTEEIFPNIDLDGSPITNNFRYTVKGNSLNATTFTEELVSSDNFTIPAYSINVFKF